MVSKAVCVSPKGAMDYFEDHLNVADYFVENEKVDRGQFIGKVAERLGLNDEPVTRERFAAFVECDMKALGADSGRQRASEIKYIEFTYSPPKAVSVVAAVDDRVKGELYAAVKEELRWFEQQVAVRDRRGNLANEEVTKPTGEMIAALFRHETSRTNDPDFHVHALIGNVTWDEERKGYFAVHFGQMLELRKTLDARIHNNLAARMGELGYQVETAPAGFGLKEVPVLASEMFSERGRQVKTVKALLQRGYAPQQITAALKGVTEDEKRQLLAKPDALQSKLGRPEGRPRLVADFVMDQTAVTLTRPKKVRISSKTLREDVAKRLDKAGLTLGPPAASPVKGNVDLTQAVRQGTQNAFDKESVVRLDHLLGEIIRLAPGAVANETLAQTLRDDRRFLIRRKDGHEAVTTREILGEEKTLLTSVINGMGQREPLQKDYVPPAALVATPQRINELVAEARARGEELTPAQAKKWLGQFAAIHRYVCTSTDQFLNVRGGAGTGKTFALEMLVNQSLIAGRPVFVVAPYGEQARVGLRNEAARLEASGQAEVARVFAQADTVDALLIRARNDPVPFRGADIYVDEAGLLDTSKALALVRLAERADARLVFQGDTAQLGAVGRGQPVKLLQDELGLGMHVPRASVSRRQLKTVDKQLAADLSSGSEEKFAGAVRQMLDRGMIRETPPDEAVEQVAKEIIAGRATGKEVVAVSSIHRVAEAVAHRVHELHVEKMGSEGQTLLDVHLKRELQQAELRSSQFYRAGDIIEYKQGEAVVRALVVSVLSDALVLEDRPKPLPLKQVRAVFDRARIGRGPGEKLLLQEKVRQGHRTFEKGSRQMIAKIEGDTVVFESGLQLRVSDGRVRQGDCLTDYKAQGLKGTQVRGIEDNGSALAMATREAFHVKGTRHVENLILHVENKALYVEAIQRTASKFSALQLERLPDSPREAVFPLVVDKGLLLVKVAAWGREFLTRWQGHKLVERVRHQLARFESVRARPLETMTKKVAPVAKEGVAEKLTPITREKLVPQLTLSIEEMIQQLQKKRQEHAVPKQKITPAPEPSPQPKETPYFAPMPQPRRGRGMRM